MPWVGAYPYAMGSEVEGTSSVASGVPVLGEPSCGGGSLAENIFVIKACPGEAVDTVTAGLTQELRALGSVIMALSVKVLNASDVVGK